MSLHLSRKHHAQLLKWAGDAENQECCGLLLGCDAAIAEIECTANVAADPYQHFEIDPAALIAAHKRVRGGGQPVLGYFHSHPNGLAQPSATDATHAADDGRFWLIIAEGQVSAWKPRGKRNGVVEFEPVALVVEG
jgi:desampylase